MLELLFVAACLNALPPVQSGAEEPALQIEPLASPAGPHSALPNLAMGANGQVLLSWIDREGPGLGVMRFAVLEESGWSAPREIMRGTDLFLNWADFPSVAALENGVLMAHWLRKSDAPHSYDAEFAISSDHGETWSDARTLHDHSEGGEHGFVSIVPMTPDRFGAIWLDGRDTVGKAPGEGDYALYFRTVGASGELGEEQVLDDRVCSCCQTSLVVDSTGSMLATYRDRSGEEIRDISQAYFHPDPAIGWAPTFEVHADGWQIDGCPVNGPRTALADDGMSVNAWFTGAGEGGGDVRLAFGALPGRIRGIPVKVDADSAIGRVDVLFADASSAVVTWLEDIGDANAEWRVRRVWNDGQMGKPIAIGQVPSTRGSGFLRMVSAGTDRASDKILAWTAPDPADRTRRKGHVVTSRLRME